jgi:hypothetical protein
MNLFTKEEIASVFNIGSKLTQKFCLAPVEVEVTGTAGMLLFISFKWSIQEESCVSLCLWKSETAYHGNFRVGEEVYRNVKYPNFKNPLTDFQDRVTALVYSINQQNSSQAQEI